MVAEMTSITILRMFFVSFKIRHEEVFFLSCFLLFSLGGSSASCCTIGSCVLIVGSGVRLGLSFHFPLPFCRLNSQLQVCLFANMLVCFSFFSLLIFYSHPLIASLPIDSCMHAPFTGCVFLSIVRFPFSVCLPVPFVLCRTALHLIYRDRVFVFFLPFCCTYFYFIFSSKYLSSFLRDGIIKKGKDWI